MLILPEATSAPSLNSQSKNPVVLVHGIKDNASKMERMARFLRRTGREAHTVTLAPSWGQIGLDDSAAQLAAFIDANFAANQKIDLVAFSMGGLISRYYVQRLGGIERVQRFVTISTPHNGTSMAYLISNPGCRQMRPKSAFLRDLNSDATMLNRVRFTSLWTPFDLIIIPARSSRLGVGQEKKLWLIAHPLMLGQPQALRTVAEFLSEAPTESVAATGRVDP